jgi:putative ABC transport system permease protein
VVPLRYNARSLIERRTTSLMTMMGVALVAMIFVILFGFIGGLRRTMLSAGNDNNWVIVAPGAPDETSSFVSHDEIEILRVRPEIVLDADHHPLLSPEAFAGVNVSRIKRFKEFALLRGVEPIAYRVHRNMHLTEGHWPVRGNGEWVIGQKLQARQPYLHPGVQFHYGRRNWNIVGIFSDHGSARESEIWCDVDDLKSDYQTTNKNANSLHVVLRPGSSAAFTPAIKNDGRLPLDAITEAQYYAAQTRVAGQLQSIGLLLAIALGIGATFGGMNTMYTAVARREREIGVLRVLGFTRRDILMSFVAESAMIGLAAGVAGLILAVIAASATGLNSHLMSVGNLFFSYQPNLSAIVAGLIAGTAIGVIGGLTPAFRAAQIRIVDSLREA